MAAIHVKDPGFCWAVCNTAAGWSYTSTRTNLPANTYPLLLKNTNVVIFNGKINSSIYSKAIYWNVGDRIRSYLYISARFYRFYCTALRYCSYGICVVQWYVVYIVFTYSNLPKYVSNTRATYIYTYIHIILLYSCLIHTCIHTYI